MEIAEDLKHIANLPGIDSRDVIQVVETILHFDRKELEPATQEMLSRLRNELIGTNFSTRLRRYVGMDIRSASAT